MSHIVLIHGFAAGVRFSVFREACGIDAGFLAFREALKNREASVFRWDMKRDATLLESLNPLYVWRLYHLEKKKAESEKTYQELKVFLEKEQPQIIVCHSMGCYLLLKFLKQQVLPASVRTIVFNQADVDRSTADLSPLVISAVQSGALRIINTHCFWDVTLLASALISGSRKMGLLSIKHTLIEDKFFPLVKLWNLHTSAIRDERFFRCVVC